MANDIEAKAVTTDDAELCIEEDRTRLLTQSVLSLLLVFAILFAGVVAFGAASYTGMIALLLIFIAALTAVWFVSKRMGTMFARWSKKTPVCSFGHDALTIYVKADVDKAQVVAYKDIKSYACVRQGNAIRLLLWGNWVSHPSGYQYVGINRPFMANTLDDLEGQIDACMKKHHVKRHK